MRFILGPAGSGKTFRCLTEIRRALAATDGPPLLLIAPKQTTYQLERQLLAYPSLPGYTRLKILSFDKLASFVFEKLAMPPPRLLDEEGRLMVLRGLLAKKRDELRLFRASARLTGFAQHLSQALRELQRHQLTPEALEKLAAEVHSVEGLSAKLHDLATLLKDYLRWLQTHQLQDADYLLDVATQALREPHSPVDIDEIWVDGFTELCPQEIDLLAEILPLSPKATMTFCLEEIPRANVSWMSNWAVVRRTFDKCQKRFAGLPHCNIEKELLPRRMNQSRFLNNPVLSHLESHWTHPAPYHEPDSASARARPLASCLRVTACANPEEEAILAAREIVQFVRAGGRYREITVLTRSLQTYHEPLVNVLNRYRIPFFLDRRESVSHHPLAELTRNALRTVALSWARNDFFAALKTGLAPAEEVEIDRLENEALARGWSGKTWNDPISIPEDPGLSEALERIRKKVVPPFEHLMISLGTHPSGTKLAGALRDFWKLLRVPEKLEGWSNEEDKPNPIHLTVWEQMNAWLDNVELAFPTESLPLREWLPILEAGLAGMTVGVIPPTLDQVVIGAIDRSRNPDIRLALVLGMNEGVFPAPPQNSVLLTDADRTALEKEGIALTTMRQQLSQERFHGYVACTRARQRLVLTHCLHDASANPLNPSPFLAQFKQLFPALEFETFPGIGDWRESEHANELIAPLLRNQSRPPEKKDADLSRLDDLPALAELREQLRHLVPIPKEESLAPALADKLYGKAIRTSVSKMEQFAACPFKFFVHSGLRAEERKKFEVDIRDQGNFQHEVLAEFHARLKGEGKRWRDITPEEARERIKSIAASHVISFREGLLQSTDETKFTARVLTDSLQDFVETLVGWMRTQYAFDPGAVELPFGDKEGKFPPWEIDLGEGHRLLLNGCIDRIDICKHDNEGEAFCVVVDYKSSQKKLDPVLLEHGLQLQLGAYLNVLRHWPNPQSEFGVAKLIPAGVFYVNLRGRYTQDKNRDEALADVEAARKNAYSHSGRFDAAMLKLLDQRADAPSGDQFNFRRKQNGDLYANSPEAMQTSAFIALLDGIEANLKKMGCDIYSGIAKINPYRKGNVTACEHCDYRSICRIDLWTHSFRVLKKAEKEDGE